MNIPTKTLRGGDQMPLVGLGFWKVEPPQLPPLIEEAIRCGYRHFDSACDYGNEVEVGVELQRALKANRCRREELWITSKLWNTYHAADQVRPAVERSLLDLRMDYLDLFLVHFPIALRYVPFETRYPPGWVHDPHAAAPHMEPSRIPIFETWRAMQELVRAGLVRNIGVSNFNVSLLRDLLSYAEIPPAVLQVELHPYLTQEKLLRFCRTEEIGVTAFSPLGAASYVSLNMAEPDESPLEQRVVLDIARRHDKTPAQVVLRWGVQRGTSVISKTSRPGRLRENLALFNFELSVDEMDDIGALNRNRRFNDPGVFCDEAFDTFFPIYD
ncbi:MAG: aldo/keto reductase [Pirellulales bacterium]